MHKWDVDGNEYVDYPGGHGALLLGHNHPAVLEAVREQLARGTHYGACHELEVRWGELIQRMVPCAQRVRLTTSGTEATLLAWRLCRGRSPGRKKSSASSATSTVGTTTPPSASSRISITPSPPGILPEFAEHTLLAPPWDWETTRQIHWTNEANVAGDLAGVIIEPTGSTWGQVPVTPAFLRSLRELTQKLGILLIFDEVISGFRCSPGGAAAALGVTPGLEVRSAKSWPAACTAGRWWGGRTCSTCSTSASPAPGVSRRSATRAPTTPCLRAAPPASPPSKSSAPPTPATGPSATAGRSRTRSTASSGRGGRQLDQLRHLRRDPRLAPNGKNLRTTRDEIESGRFDYATIKAPVLSPSTTLQDEAASACCFHGGVDVQPLASEP